MSWNYRIFKRAEKYSIRETLIKDGKIVGNSVEVCFPFGYSSVEELEGYILDLQEALNKPVIDYDTYEEI